MTRFVPPLRCLAPAIGWSLPVALAFPLTASHAQEPPVRIRTFEGPRALALGTATNPGRAVIGVGLTTGTRADTAGLEITEVTPDGPAAAAGLTPGTRLEAIDGVSLRISADDAADPLTADAGYRRLQRELAKRSPGDEVELRVREGNVSRIVRVTTVAERDLRRARVGAAMPGRLGTREVLAQRAALGVGLASAGNARDTLGVFVTNVVAGGPADRAGIAEGDRIAAIDGVDVRVPREDVADPQAGRARVQRLLRTVEAASPGDALTLRVYQGGRYRDVVVTAGTAAEVGTGGYRFEFRSGPDGVAVPRPPHLEGDLIARIRPLLEARPLAPRAPDAPSAPDAPPAPGRSVRSVRSDVR